MEELNWFIECSAFVVMLGISVVIGLYYGCVEGKQKTVSEYLLGGKHMTVFPITMSLITSHISGITLLGTPSEVYTNGTQYLIVCLVNVFVVAITIYVYLPVFYELQLTSVYEYLELRFNSNIRGFASLIFAVSLIFYIPVVIYVPALALNQVTGINIHYVTPIICAICIFYTTIGGLKAVVWTDAIQGVFTTASIMIVIVLGLIKVGGINNMIKANQDGDRLEFLRMDLDPFLRNTIWTVGVGTIFQWTALLGLHPGAVQRFVALPTYKKARSALIYYLIGIAVVKVFTGMIGMLIYTNYKDCDPVSANYIASDRNVLPYFVMDVAAKLPGVTGLFISGIISAALSTMSAQLNTVSGTIYEDFVVKVMGVKRSELTASIIMKSIVVVTGLICVALVAVVEKLSGITQVAISLMSLTSGALLAVFTLGVCFPWANSRGAMCGMLTSLGITFWVIYGAQMAIYKGEIKFTEKKFSIAGCPSDLHFKNRTDYSGLYQMNEDVYVGPNVWKIYTVSYMYYTALGCFIGIAVGLVVSILFPQEQDIDPKLLSPFIRKFMYPKYMAKENSDGVQTNEYKPVCQDSKL